jgi:hypothetical protein
MADNLTKVGSFELFDIEPNWADDIAFEHQMSRRLIAYAMGAATLEAIAPEIPVAFELQFLCEDKQAEYDLLTFFISKKGRLTRFWLRHPAAAFTLKTNASSGASGLYCKRNRFDLVYQGYERIYILMATGDIIVRKVTACVDGADYTYIGFDTTIDRDVTTTNHIRIGRLLLGRFNSDKAKFEFKTSTVSTVTLAFSELVKEYSLAD